MKATAARVAADRMCSDDVMRLLAARHPAEKAVFIEECKMGQAGSRRLDAWVLLKTWSPWTTIGYEVKVNRSDFLGDRKHETYLPVCHELYFACPAWLIAPEELPPSIGLLWASGGRLTTKRKAARREVDHEQLTELMSYALMSRSRVVADMWRAADETDGEYWRRVVAEKADDLKVGRIASTRIKGLLDAARRREREAEGQRKNFEHIERRLIELGFDPRREVYTWQLDNRLQRDEYALKTALRQAQLVVRTLEQAQQDHAAQGEPASGDPGGEGE